MKSFVRFEKLDPPPGGVSTPYSALFRHTSCSPGTGAYVQNGVVCEAV